MLTELKETSQNIIREEANLIDALAMLDKTAIKVLFVINEKNQLVAALTDGDVRRALLAGEKVDCAVSNFANCNPTFIKPDADLMETEKIMAKKDINAIPVVDDNSVIQKIYIRGKVKGTSTGKKLDTPIVIMAGGKGTRLYPYTKILPKALIPIADTPITERIMKSFMEYGCDNFHIIVNHKKNMIKAYFGEERGEYSLSFWDEDIPLGTGGGLKMLEDTLKSTFVLTNCDILILEDVRNMVEHHRNSGNAVTMVCSLKTFEVPYGVVNFTSGGEIESFEEKPTMSYFTNTGYYIVEPDIFEYIGKDEAIGMPDILDRMRSDGRKIGVYPIGENAWLDMGQFDSMESMERRLKELE